MVSGESILPQSSEELDLDGFFTVAIAQQVSDIHLRVNHPPSFRKHGKIMHSLLPPLTSKAMQRFAQWLVPEVLRAQITKRHDVDFSVDFRQARLRVNLLYEMGHLAFVIRVIPTIIPNLSSLGHPAGMLKLTTLAHGLVLVTGATGSGKSTTLAALLDDINRNQSKHIVTLEDPVEFIYRNSKSIVTQRQLGIDTPTFPAGVKYALRQDPDVLLIGEMRDRETAMSAIKAAETGCLVFSTLHTSDALQTFHRIIDFFEPHERDAIRQQLANVLQGVVCQKLYNHRDGTGMSAVAEVLMITPTVRDYLIRNQVDEIALLMDEGRFEGMQTMNVALYNLLRAQDITAEEALRVSNNPTGLQRRLKGGFHGTGLGEDS